MAAAFFVLSFTAVVVLFGSIIAALGWLIFRALRVLVRLMGKVSGQKVGPNRGLTGRHGAGAHSSRSVAGSA